MCVRYVCMCMWMCGCVTGDQVGAKATLRLYDNIQHLLTGTGGGKEAPYPSHLMCNGRMRGRG